GPVGWVEPQAKPISGVRAAASLPQPSRWWWKRCGGEGDVGRELLIVHGRPLSAAERTSQTHCVMSVVTLTGQSTQTLRQSDMQVKNIKAKCLSENILNPMNR